MLRATQAGRLTVAPQDEDGETPFPDHRGFREQLTYEADEEFDVRDKLTADFADLSPQHAGIVAKKLDRLLGEQNPHFEYIEAADEGADEEETD